MRKHIEIVFDEQFMRGYLDYVNNDECIIVVHGIGGNKLGNKFIFKQFADKANENNISTLRMDFLGTGESDGKFELTNHIEQTAQLHQIIKYAKEVLNFKKIHLAGTSIGCLVILNTVKTFNDDIETISLWNPNIDVKKYIKEYDGKTGEIDMGGLFLTSAYVPHLYDVNIDYDFTNENIAIMHGVKDYNYKIEYVNKFVEDNKCEYFEIEDGCHLFESNIAREALFNRTIEYVQSKRK